LMACGGYRQSRDTVNIEHVGSNPTVPVSNIRTPFVNGPRNTICYKALYINDGRQAFTLWIR
jgi:hypothetical protein